jgi:hypothetical protein
VFYRNHKTMKIEIDVNDTAHLRTLEAELIKWLGMVRYALNGTNETQRSGSAAPSSEDVNESDRRIAEVLRTVSDRFTSATVRQAIGDSLTRAAVNAALMRAEQRGEIHTVQRGMGRRPATFQKGPAA